MPYDQFDSANPVIGQSRFAAIESTRKNMLALRDMAIAGMYPGFNFSKAGGTAAEPAQIFHKKGAEWFRATLTWVDGNVTIAVHEYSSDSGAFYSPVGTESITYDAAANINTILWS